MSSRLCVRVAGAPEWHLVTCEAFDGWAALEKELLRCLRVDARCFGIQSLALCIRDDPPCLLARDCVHHLRDMDRVEVELRNLSEPSALTPPAAATAGLPNTPQLRGVKRYPATAAPVAHAAKAQAPSRDATPAPPAAEEEDEDDVPPLRCFRMAEVRGRPLLVGEKPGGGAIAAQLAWLAQHGVTSIISLAALHKVAADEAQRHGIALRAAAAADDRESGFSVEQLDAFSAHIDDALQRGGGVYVHCNHGRSRSPSVAMAYLMRCRNRTYLQARRAVQMGVARAAQEGLVGLAPSVLEPSNSERAGRFVINDAQLRDYDILCKKRRAEAAAGFAGPARTPAKLAADDDDDDAESDSGSLALEAAGAGGEDVEHSVLAELLQFAKEDDGVSIRRLLADEHAVAACRRLGAADVNPLHVAVLALNADAAAALLASGAPFSAGARGRVDLSDRGDGLGDVRRALPYCCSAADVLDKRWQFYHQNCLIMKRAYAHSAAGLQERNRLDAMAQVLSGGGGDGSGGGADERDAPIPAPSTADA